MINFCVSNQVNHLRSTAAVRPGLLHVPEARRRTLTTAVGTMMPRRAPYVVSHRGTLEYTFRFEDISAEAASAVDVATLWISGPARPRRNHRQ
jgi:hypothetical protein